jgi:predicted CXXCH cytochrome family protein
MPTFGSSAGWKLAIGGALLVTPVATLFALRFGFDPVEHEARQPLIHRDDGFVGSTACRACHENHYESWGRTFHRTMTQRATPETVVGVFDGRAVTYEGKTARPIERDGRFFMQLPLENGGTREAEVALTVGSRRYQQYFERESRGSGFAFVRLPILWHIEARRWLHLNAVFLNPDSADWDDHRSVWNENCILCHNTAPQVRMTNYREPSRAQGGQFDSEVGELGIACEACHGPGREHSERLRDPLRRYGDRLARAEAEDIVDPLELDKERSVAVCGQCHGQRLPKPLSRVEAWLTSGPTFRSGERLSDHVEPIRIDTPVLGQADPDLFRFRFWGDGTPRLTAYEYQGTTTSPCYLKGSMTCNSCHTMHGGDVRGQVEPRMRTNEACTQCHAEIGRDVAAHTHHEADSSGSQCMECHMPRIVYGVVEIHRSHRIENPDPARDAEAGRPDACTLCHLDKSAQWTADEMARMWGKPYRRPSSRKDGAPLELADAVASVLAGDAVQRAVYAKAMGRGDSALDPLDKAFLRQHLAITMGDGYPSVRWMAQRSLAQLERELPTGLGSALDAIDFLAGPEQRRNAVLTLIARIAERARGRLHAPAAGQLVGTDFTPELEAVFRLTDLQGLRSISIGE